MHDSATPPPSPDDPQTPPGLAPDSGTDSAVAAEEAHQIVRTVLAWYNRELLAARRAGDQQQLEELTAERKTCVEDQIRLRDAGPEEVARIAGVYTERLKELEASGPPAGA